MNGFQKKLVTGAIVATVAALSCPAVFAMGGPGGGGMGGGQMGGGSMGGQMGGGMQQSTQTGGSMQQGGQTGSQQQGSFGQMSFTQNTQSQSVDTMSSATTQSGQSQQSTQNSQQNQMPTQNSQQQGQMPTQNGQQQGQMPTQNGQTSTTQNGQQQSQMPGSGQMPGQNGQGGQQGGLLESLAKAVGVTTTTTASTDKDADADTLVSSIKTAVEALDSDDLAALAKTYNIDTTDKTDAEILTAVEKLLEKPSDNGQGQNGQQQGQMPGQNGQGGQQGGLLESLAKAVGVTTTTTASTDKDASADTLVSSIKTAVEALDSDDLAALAKTYNIDTTDKTDAEILTAVEKLLEKPSDNGQGQQNGQMPGQNGQGGQQGGLLESLAKAVGVTTTTTSTTGTSTDADTLVSSIKTAVEALDSDDLAALAKTYNIDTTDKTDAEIVAAVEKLLEKPSDNGQGQNGQTRGNGKGMLESLAADAGVTVTSGEKPDAIVTAIKTAVEALDSDDLAALAEKYDIDTTDKTDAELVTAIEALLTPPTGK